MRQINGLFVVLMLAVCCIGGYGIWKAVRFAQACACVDCKDGLPINCTGKSTGR